MKVKIYPIKEICFIFFFMIANGALGQQTDCKVMMPAIAGVYSGECKKGLANGNGIAQGTDHYEGQFKKGLPDGKGTYTWANGSFYKGQWRKGLKSGTGKMVYRTSAGDSIVTGYWEYDNYMGKAVASPYTILRKIGVVRSGFRMITDIGNDVTIRIFLGGNINSDIEGFSMAYDSGDEYKSGTAFGIQNVRFPLEVKIKYRTWNQFHTSQSDVTFEFELLKPGKWEITITN
jgi:hypothetical protein